MNNYEVNLIDKYYLQIWNRSRLQNFIPLERILNDFNSPYHGIVQTYFHYFHIYYDDYFLFVCVFAFCDFSQILYILLASCQLYPAKYISKKEINMFLKSTKITNFSYEMFDKIVQNTMNNNNNASPSSPTSPESPTSRNISITTCQYRLKSFISCILSCDNYKKLVSDIKKTLINVVITPSIYKTIIKRQIFYNNNNNSNLIIPREPCTTKTIRKLFSNRPEPYHYDFRLQKLSSNAINDVVKKIIFNYKASGTLSPSLEISKRKLKVNNINEKDNNNYKVNNKMIVLSDRMHHCPKNDGKNLRKIDSENIVRTNTKELSTTSPLQLSSPPIFIIKVTPVNSMEESKSN